MKNILLFLSIIISISLQAQGDLSNIWDQDEIICKESEHASHFIHGPAQRNQYANETDMVYQLMNWEIDPANYYIKGNKLDEQPKEPTKMARSAAAVKVNQTLTPKTRREVLKRDKCCQFRNKETGEICGETRFAQVDHKTALWAGGTHDIGNLQQLCANHNRRKYRREAQLSWL